MTLPSTIAHTVVWETVVRKSRFIAQVSPVDARAQAEAVVAAVRREHWTARHHCVAWVIGTDGVAQRSSDDGEPSGTAGLPMLEVLHRRGLSDIVAVVTRYFGGVLLGTGGLARAYSGALTAALEHAVVVHRTVVTQISVELDHGTAARLHGVVAGWCRERGGLLDAVSYGQVAVMSVGVPVGVVGEFEALVAAETGGRARVCRGGQRVASVPTGGG